MNKVILSFDYELFFGDKSGTVENSLITPTNKLLDCMESVGFRGNFFVDWQMLKYLKEEGVERTDADYNLIVNQLKEIVRRGHRIELHIHPHWVDAKYNGDGTWDFSDFTHYSLNSFNEEEIIQMFEDGVSLLTDIAREVDPTYKIVAFRAGGWAVQPYYKLKKAFLKTEIKIDSSVMRGAYAKNEGSYYDFRNVPFTKDGFYRFEDDVCKEMVDGTFMEVPISNVKQGFWYRVIRRIYAMLPNHDIKCLTDGTHTRKNSVTLGWSHEKVSLTFSNVNPWNVLFAQARNNSYISCYIDHPKDFTNNTLNAIKALSNFTVKSINYCDLLYLKGIEL